MRRILPIVIAGVVAVAALVWGGLAIVNYRGIQSAEAAFADLAETLRADGYDVVLGRNLCFERHGGCHRRRDFHRQRRLRLALAGAARADPEFGWGHNTASAGGHAKRELPVRRDATHRGGRRPADPTRIAERRQRPRHRHRRRPDGPRIGRHERRPVSTQPAARRHRPHRSHLGGGIGIGSQR